MTSELEDLKRFIGGVQRTRAERSGSKEKARQCLYEEGMIDKDGNLTPEYGGPGNSTSPKQRTSTHPGAILREDDVLPELFAEKIGVDAEELKEILAERADVTPVIAEKLGAYLGNGAEIWLALQRRHNELKAIHDELSVPEI